eukprot:Skav224141  [mRNA]  locus=scaffold462:217590:221410:- [translate_table: standard]
MLAGEWSFGNATRNFHLARSAYLDGSDLGLGISVIVQWPPEQQRSNEIDGDQREDARAQQRRDAWSSRMTRAMDGAFGAVLDHPVKLQGFKIGVSFAPRGLPTLMLLDPVGPCRHLCQEAGGAMSEQQIGGSPLVDQA